MEISANTGNILVGDSASLVVAGIVSIILGSELPAERSSYIASSLNHIRWLWLTTYPNVVTQVYAGRTAIKTKSSLKATPLKLKPGVLEAKDVFVK